VRARLDELPDTDVVLMTFTDPSNVAAYRQRHAVDLPVVIDRDRSTYQAFGLGRGSLTRIWGLRAAKRYAEILRNDGLSGLRRPTDDTRQLGGDFVIDPEGTLIYGFWGEGPDDRPSIDDLVAAVNARPTR